jgi:hypothetical protein
MPYFLYSAYIPLISVLKNLSKTRHRSSEWAGKTTTEFPDETNTVNAEKLFCQRLRNLSKTEIFHTNRKYTKKTF